MLHRVRGSHLTEDPATFWNRRAKPFAVPHARLRVIARLIEESQGPRKTLLDVGCGPASLRQVLPAGTEYFGADVADEIIAGFSDPAHFQALDWNRSGRIFDGRLFDVIVCSGFLEYTDDLGQALDRLRSQLAPGGRIVASYMNHAHWSAWRFVLTGRTRSLPDPHKNFLTLRELMGTFRRSRLRIERSVALHQDLRELPWPWSSTRAPWNLRARQFVFLLRPESPPPSAESAAPPPGAGLPPGRT
jgi:2-polyprenyl-3-methyl-5-hydroxy-6-metoxy-1,4-benzoquinol methylase